MSLRRALSRGCDLQGYTGRERRDTPISPGEHLQPPGYCQLQLRQLIFDGFATQNDIMRLGCPRRALFRAPRHHRRDRLRSRRRLGLGWLRYREFARLGPGKLGHPQGNRRPDRTPGQGRRRPPVDLEQAFGRLALASPTGSPKAPTSTT